MNTFFTKLHNLLDTRMFWVFWLLGIQITEMFQTNGNPEAYAAALFAVFAITAKNA